MMNNLELEKYLNGLLEVDLYNDYCPNGLQVEGKTNISKIIFGVTASAELIDEAIKCNADAIIVHHGYFWKGERDVITGIKKSRIKKLLVNDINLYAYHLPLDGHKRLGNNYQLAKVFDVLNPNPVTESLIWVGDVKPITPQEMMLDIENKLGRTPMFISGGNHNIKRIAWCSGGAQNMFEKAIELKVDAYISGEVSEQTYHLAKEYGIHYFAAGHHATECGGVSVLAEELSKIKGMECRFIDCINPV